MKLNFSTPLTDFEGKPIEEDQAGTKVSVTLGTIAQRALAAGVGEDKLTGDQKFARFLLGVKIARAMSDDGVADLKVEEIAIIKTSIGNAFQPVVAGSAWMIIEGATSMSQAAE